MYDSLTLLLLSQIIVRGVGQRLYGYLPLQLHRGVVVVAVVAGNACHRLVRQQLVGHLAEWLVESPLSHFPTFDI